MRWQWLTLLLLTCTSAAPAADIWGYVYSVRGDWRLAPQFAVSLKPGMELHAGETIKLMNSARPAHINAGQLNGALWKQDCDTDADCLKPVALPAPDAAATLPERMKKLIAGFGSHPTQMVFTLSRGGDGDPREAVLPLRGRQADLAPALRTIASGTVTAKLIPLANGAAAPEVTCKLSTACAAPASRPGLYKLEVRAGEREAQTVLVLVAASADYPRMNEMFLEAQHVADSWGTDAHPDARHYFLSASLEELQRTAGKAH